MKLKQKQAAKLVSAVLLTLYEIRQFKHDLIKFEDENPQLFKEMLKSMQNDLIAEAKNLRMYQTKHKGKL